MFGYTYGATIKNLTISGSVSASSNYSGSFVAYAKGTLILDNCKSSVNVYGKGYAGGFVGYGSFNNAMISKCTFTGSVTGTTNVGGIIGKAYKDSTSATNSKISMCRVVVNPNSNPNSSSEFSIQRVEGTTSVGGIAGELTGATIEQCYTTIKVYGKSEVGGIAGNVLYGQSAVSTIQDCFTTGDIYCSTTGNNGGIAGKFYATSSTSHYLKRCYSTSDVYTAKGTQTGGIVGDNGGTSNYSSISTSFAINRQVFQVGTSTNSTGRVGGTESSGYSNNAAKSTMPIYWKATSQNVTSSSIGKHGSNITDAELKTSTPYISKGWDFNNVWIINSSFSVYPVLRWIDNIVPPVLVVDVNAKTINIGESFDITASGLIAGDSVVWLGSNNENIATISTSGNIATVTGLAEGVAIISVRTEKGALTKTTVVTVRDITLPTELIPTLEIGQKCFISALTMQNIEAEKTFLYTWTSSNTSIATINSRGEVTAVGLGIVEITAVKDGITKTIKVLVRATPIYPVEEIKFEPSEINLIRGAIYTPIMPTFYPSDAAIPTLIWNSDNEFVVGLNSAGQIAALQGEQSHSAYIEPIGITNSEVNANGVLTAKGWNNSTNSTPKAWQIYIPNANYSSFAIEYEQRSTDASPNNFVLQYSTDEITWSDVVAYNVRTGSMIATDWCKTEANVTPTNVTGELYIRIRNDSNSNYLTGILGANAQSFLRKIKVSGIN